MAETGHNTLNYEQQGGSVWYIGGELQFASGATMTVAGTQASAITSLTDSTGAASNDSTLADGLTVTALTDNSAGATADGTIEAMANPTDSPATADALRDDIVANLLPSIRNNFKDVATKINTIVTDISTNNDNISDLAVKVNAILAALRGVGIVAP